ncbi:MAG: hypothetical protein ACI3V3_00850 [Faecousia sp.]
MHYLISLALTLALELPLAWLLRVRGRDLALVAVANLLTNPAVVLVHGLLAGESLLLHTVLPELWAVTTEAMVYKHLGANIKNPMRFSILANLLSYSLGAVLQLCQ